MAKTRLRVRRVEEQDKESRRALLETQTLARNNQGYVELPIFSTSFNF